MQYGGYCAKSTVFRSAQTLLCLFLLFLRYRHSRHSSKRRLSIMGHVSHVESRALASASPPGRKATDLLHIVNRSVARLDGLRKRREVTLRDAQLSVAYCEPSLTRLFSRPFDIGIQCFRSSCRSSNRYNVWQPVHVTDIVFYYSVMCSSSCYSLAVT